MAKEYHPIKATNSRLAPLDDWQFIASEASTVTVDAFDIESRRVQRIALAFTTTAQLAVELTGAGKLGNHRWWQIVSISAGAIYGLSVEDPGILTATTGMALAVGQQIGRVPKGPTSGDEVEVVASALPTGAATSAKQDTLIAKDFATAAKQDTGNTSLASILGELEDVERDYATLLDEALPAIAASAQIFINAPASTKLIYLTLRSAGATLTFDAAAATAGANGHDFAHGTMAPHVFRLNQTQALLVRANENGGTATGHVTYRG